MGVRERARQSDYVMDGARTDPWLLPLRDIGGAMAVCTLSGRILAATAAADLLFDRLGIGEQLPQNLWAALGTRAAGSAVEWRPPIAAEGTLGCSRYGLGQDRFLLVMREISELQLQASHRLQVHRIETAARLVALVAHDLRAPLATLVLNMDVLCHGWQQLGPDDVEACITACNQATEHLRATIDGLVDFARVGPTVAGPLDLASVFTRVAGMVRPVLRAGGHRLNVALADDATRILGNQLAVEQIFYNLVVNAAEACRHPAEIRISSVRCAADDALGRRPMVAIRVHDDGPGISADVRGHVFEPSFSTKPGGAGVGLYLARDAAVMCEGGLALEDSDSGACFVVTLPAEVEP